VRHISNENLNFRTRIEIDVSGILERSDTLQKGSAMFKDARHLIENCKGTIGSLGQLIGESLSERTIKPALLVNVKNFAENLRSSLDYCAHALFVKHGRSDRSNPRIYFPYVPIGQNRDEFRRRVRQCIPGLFESRPDIVDLLEEYQWFGTTGRWLPVLAEIANRNKHERLTPQVQRNYALVRITGTLKKGESVDIDLKRIRLGKQSPENAYDASAVTWTDLEFEGTGVSVMSLLRLSLVNVDSIIRRLERS